MQLLPQGTVRRQLFEFCDRSLGWMRFRQFRPISNICGDQIVSNKPVCRFCFYICSFLNKYVEADHCKKNAGKP